MRMPETTGARGLLIPVVSFVASITIGCGGSADQVSFSGKLRLDGQPVPAELQFEQLDAEGSRVGRSVTVYADDQGDFKVSMITAAGTTERLECSLVVRVSRLTPKGLPAAFDYDAPPEKVVRLRRSMANGDSLSILLTQ